MLIAVIEPDRGGSRHASGLSRPATRRRCDTPAPGPIDMMEDFYRGDGQDDRVEESDDRALTVNVVEGWRLGAPQGWSSPRLTDDPTAHGKGSEQPPRLSRSARLMGTLGGQRWRMTETRRTPADEMLRLLEPTVARGLEQHLSAATGGSPTRPSRTRTGGTTFRSRGS